MARKRTDVDRSKERYENLYLARALSIRQVGVELGLSAALVRKDMRRLGISMRPEGIQKHVGLEFRTAENYQRLYHDEQMSLREISRVIGVDATSVMNDMRRFGIATRAITVTEDELTEREQLYADEQSNETEFPGERAYIDEPRYVDGLDTTFFRIIDSEIKAYALGLIWSDGSIDAHYSMMRITLQESDWQTLEALRSAMGALPLERHRPYEKSGGKTPTVTLRVRDTRIVQDLIALGLVENKSARLPMAVPPPPALERAFVRGLMDGDGSLYGMPKYPQIVFYNQNPSLRQIVVRCWTNITGERPPTYAPMGEGKRRPRVNEVGDRAKAIAYALYLDGATVSLDRKRARAEEFQNWTRRPKRGGPAAG